MTAAAIAPSPVLDPRHPWEPSRTHVGEYTCPQCCARARLRRKIFRDTYAPGGRALGNGRVEYARCRNVREWDRPAWTSEALGCRS